MKLNSPIQSGDPGVSCATGNANLAFTVIPNWKSRMPRESTCNGLDDGISTYVCSIMDVMMTFRDFPK